MAGLQMGRAFNSKMLSRVLVHAKTAGAYDEMNDWVEGVPIKFNAFVVVRASKKGGEGGETLQSDTSGNRTSDYKQISFQYPRFQIEVGDKIEYKGKYYNVLNATDHDEYGFKHMVIEKSDNWTPPTSTQRSITRTKLKTIKETK